MLVTIILGSCVFIQGVYERQLDNGMVTVRVGDRLFTGRPANCDSFA